MCVNGTWSDIILDDYLPVRPGTKSLIYGHAKSINGVGVLWVSLLEKAWAKLCGNYDRIINGAADIGFMHLTGVPALKLKNIEYRANKEAAWDRIELAAQMHHLMLAGISDESAGIEKDMGNGLLSNHCYSILSVNKIKINNQQVRLLKIRNPLGRQAYRGAWSPTSQEWTP